MNLVRNLAKHPAIRRYFTNFEKIASDRNYWYNVIDAMLSGGLTANEKDMETTEKSIFDIIETKVKGQFSPPMPLYTNTSIYA
jgi:hypothetical protein